MGSLVCEAGQIGIDYMAFGDLFLEDVRQYREKQLRGTGIRPLFPIWKMPTYILTKQMLSSGVEAYISCVDLQKVPKTLVGR